MVFAFGLKETASQFNFTYRYVDDVLSINNPDFMNYLCQMYPAELGDICIIYLILHAKNKRQYKWHIY